MDLFEDTGMRGLANKLGFRYVGYPRDEDYHADTGGLPTLPLLAEVGGRDVTDLMYGRLEGANAQVFNVHIEPYEPDPRHPDRSCVAITFAADFPKILLGPHTHMSRLRQRTAWKRVRGLSEQFTDRFSIEALDPSRVPVVLGEAVAEWLTGQRPDLRIEIQGGALLGHVPHLDEDDLPDLVEAVHGVHRRIPEAAWVEYGLFGLL